MWVEFRLSKKVKVSVNIVVQEWMDEADQQALAKETFVKEVVQKAVIEGR